MELMQSRKPVLFLHRGSSITGFFGSGKDDLLLVGPGFFTELLEYESCVCKRFHISELNLKSRNFNTFTYERVDSD
ncbi:hypothetical protein Hanom_Chr15g01394001 [Helianthus anomalus]